MLSISATAFVCLVQAAAGRRIHGIQYKALVFRGDKPAGRALHDQVCAAGKDNQPNDSDPFVTEQETQATHIFMRHGLETHVEGSKEPGRPKPFRFPCSSVEWRSFRKMAQSAGLSVRALTADIKMAIANV